MCPVEFDELERADLIIDTMYRGGHAGNAGDDPIGRLVPVGNQGGFRYQGGSKFGGCRLLVLYTSGEELDWPDFIDFGTGRFTYYGDNRSPGHQLHETKRKGNAFLRDMFAALHDSAPRRSQVPPILVFEKAGAGRDVFFRGLAVPGAAELTPLEDLVAAWKSKGHERFQNYRAVFTILNVPFISRVWLQQVLAGTPFGSECPQEWRFWVEHGGYAALRTERVVEHRSREQQLPQDTNGLGIVGALYDHFKPDPYQFEGCAAKLWRMLEPGVGSIEVTRRSRDGGRDAVGRLGIGPHEDRVQMDFALEAKCYALKNAVGVQEVARLISRLRHRQFGVLVTTSYVASQAYEELRKDQHPVVVVAATDIVSTLRRHQIDSINRTRQWLADEFQLRPSASYHPPPGE